MNDSTPGCELSVVMPCLNEERTVGECVDVARRAMAEAGIDGEVVIADNGSTDRSVGIAAEHGARVVHVAEKGYGSALRGGIEAAAGRFILMGDADLSYDFAEAPRFCEKLREGHDVVMGSRRLGTIERGAMPITRSRVVPLISTAVWLAARSESFTITNGVGDPVAPMARSTAPRSRPPSSVSPRMITMPASEVTAAVASSRKSGSSPLKGISATTLRIERVEIASRSSLAMSRPYRSSR